jgi:asparagine synthase (glutamine-hydrolysing)
MCGIAGIVYPDPERPVDEERLRRMAAAIRHRGPDDEGFWTGPGVGLAHRRLSIIDLSAAGRQPMCNEDGSVWLVFNGEIYNFPELRRELEQAGHHFRSQTDSEVIVHLYEEHGVDCVERLEGMFAFAVWDAARRRLLLARDRVGKKPLKYVELDGGIAFASELKALLAGGLVEPRVEPDDLVAYLRLGYVPAPGTGLCGVRKLAPGHRLVWEQGQVEVAPYWSLDFRPKRELGLPDWKRAVRQTVQRAVERRLVSDVPLGAFLSGGIDSSIVVACMAEAAAGPVETFSIGFTHEAYNELPYARQVAERFRTRHHEFVVEADSASLMPVLAELYEEPYADSSALPTWLLARETRKHVTVALNGDGGDEGFAGYRRYEELLRRRARLRLARSLGARALTALALRATPGSGSRWSRRLDALHHLLHPELGSAYAFAVRDFSERDLETLCGADLSLAAGAPESGGVIPALARDPRAGRAELDRLLWIDTRTYLPDDLLVKVDLASMAHGLEARSPLLDREVLELAASAPAELKLRGSSLKWLLKQAFRDRLPPDLVERPKQGFGIPIHAWFRGPLLPLARDLLLGRDARAAEWLRPDALESLVERHAAGRGDRGYQLWSLCMLELWLRRYPGGRWAA